MHIKIRNMAEGYADVLEVVRTFGKDHESRGMKHREIVSVEIEVTQPWYGMPTGVRRSLNASIGVLEAAQLIAGEATPQLMVKAAKQFESYKDGDVFHGSYGPRLRPQIPLALSRLSDDEGSRQAVVTVWDPLYDLTQGRRDLPCTTAMQFLVRDGHLNMITYMRSNDAWLGLPYDVFQFTQLQQAVAWALKVEQGSYFHHVGSLHLYEEHIDRSAMVISRRSSIYEEWPVGFECELTDPIERWVALRDRAAMALDGRRTDGGRLIEEAFDHIRHG